MKTVLKSDHIMITRMASVKITVGTVIKAILNCSFEDSFSYVQAAVRSKILWRFQAAHELYTRGRGSMGRVAEGRDQPAALGHLCWPMREASARLSSNESVSRAGAELLTRSSHPTNSQPKLRPPSALAPTTQGRLCQWSFDILFSDFSIPI